MQVFAWISQMESNLKKDLSHFKVEEIKVMCNLYLEVNSFIYCKLFKSIVCSHRWMLLCNVTVGNRAVCWYENRSAAIKFCHVVFHTVMNVVHYCWKECSWLVQKLLSSYETSLIDCLCTLWNVVTLRLEGVQLVATGTAQLLHCVIV